MAASVHLVPAQEREANHHPEISGTFPLDEAVLEVLPPGLTVSHAESYGTSAWSVTARITTHTEDKSIVQFFLKVRLLLFVSDSKPLQGIHIDHLQQCATEASGKAQLEGEFEAMSALYEAAPHFVPRPRGHGKLKIETPPTYFLVCDFVNISDDLPDPVQLGKKLAQLHRNSLSPTGKFGFHVPTYDGRLPQVVDWDSSWASFFGNMLLGILELDLATNGSWKALEEVVHRTVQEVIPILLGNLEAEGRSINPCLIHGDLWEGNIGTELGTGNLFIFDACSYFGHHEMELGIWRTDHHRMKAKAYQREYLRNMKPSEPVDQWDDRNRLYSCKTRLMYSAHVPGSQVRQQAYNELSYLIQKYTIPIELEPLQL